MRSKGTEAPTDCMPWTLQIHFICCVCIVVACCCHNRQIHTASTLITLIKAKSCFFFLVSGFSIDFLSYPQASYQVNEHMTFIVKLTTLISKQHKSKGCAQRQQIVFEISRCQPPLYGVCFLHTRRRCVFASSGVWETRRYDRVCVQLSAGCMSIDA